MDSICHILYNIFHSINMLNFALVVHNISVTFCHWDHLIITSPPCILRSGGAMLGCYRSAELSAAMSSTSVAAAVTKAVTNTRPSGEEEAGAEFVHRVLFESEEWSG